MCRILNYTRIKPRSRPPQKKSAYFTHLDFSTARIGKKVRKLREQIRYYLPFRVKVFQVVSFLRIFHQTFSKYRISRFTTLTLKL